MNGVGYWQDPLLFLLETAFTLYTLVVMLRMLLQIDGLDRYNPVHRALVSATEPPLQLLRRLIPAWRGVDLAAIVLMLLLQLTLYALVAAIAGLTAPPGMLLRLAMVELTLLLFNVYTFSILIEVVLSWVNPGAYHPALAVIYQLNAPVLGRVRQLLPATGGLDLSPLVALVLIQVLRMLIAPLGAA